VLVLVTALTEVGVPSLASGSTPLSNGVTPTTIRVGIPYQDLHAVLKFGVTLDLGNFPDAYNALIADLNAHGGINGRQIVPYLVPVSTFGTAPAASACTKLTEDDRVLVAINPYEPDCYLQDHHTPTINGDFQSAQALGGVPNFSLFPPPAVYDRLQLSVFQRRGVFAGKRLGLFAGGLTDQGELRVVQSILTSLHVPVVQTAVIAAPAGDESAYAQQLPDVVQHFQEARVSEVIAVGSGSVLWPKFLDAIQSSYNPPWVATDEGVLDSAVQSKPSISSTYLRNVVTSSPTPASDRFWRTPSMQRCARVIHEAYPTDKITPPANPQIGDDKSWYAVEVACISVALFATIAKAAGANLTTSSFIDAGYRLRDAVIPGQGAPISFGQGRSYVIGPVYLVTYDPVHHSLKFSSSSVTPQPTTP
jgi:hypothetical protein